MVGGLKARGLDDYIVETPFVGAREHAEIVRNEHSGARFSDHAGAATGEREHGNENEGRDDDQRPAELSRVICLMILIHFRALSERPLPSRSR